MLDYNKGTNKYALKINMHVFYSQVPNKAKKKKKPVFPVPRFFFSENADPKLFFLIFTNYSNHLSKN